MSWEKFNGQSEEKHDYWMSYSDLMAGLILILILYLSISANTYNESTIRKNNVEKQLLDQQRLLDQQQKKIEEIIGVRSKIIKKLIEQFSESELAIEVDQKTGAIRLESGVFFEVDQFRIKSNGKVFLKQFVPQYLDVLLDKELRDYIGEIIIEGHTDTKGRYEYNLDLSQKRALSVAQYILRTDFETLTKDNKERLKSILTANGRSFSNPVLKENGKIDPKASRRVEFKFRLRDSEMIEEMNQILSKDNMTP